MQGSALSQQQDPMAAYGQQYASQLQTALQGLSTPSPSAMDAVSDSASDSALQPNDLGPDDYQGPKTADPRLVSLAQRGDPEAKSVLQRGGTMDDYVTLSQPGSKPSSQPSALAEGSDQDGDDSDSQGAEKKAVSFRDAWQQQSKADREQRTQQFESELAKGKQTIASAYQQMMDKLGTRPQTGLSKEDKGMLLMEFGMRLMQNSASPQQGGFGQNVGGAAGAAGLQTLQSQRGIQAQKLGAAQRWDQQQTQIGEAAGKEEAGFTERALLEEGRDQRAYDQQDAMLQRVGIQQQGAADRVGAQQKGAMDRRVQAGQDALTREKLRQDNQNQRAYDALKAKADQTKNGGGYTGVEKWRYDTYLAQHSHNADGTPLSDDDLQKVQQDAFTAATSKKGTTLSDAEIEQDAIKATDAERRVLQQQYTDMPDADYQKRIQQRIGVAKQIRDAGTGGSGAPTSALAPRPAPTGSALAPGAAPAGGGSALAPQANNVPTQPPGGGAGANPKQLQFLAQNPALAGDFLKKFGYVPTQFVKYLKPGGSAL